MFRRLLLAAMAIPGLVLAAPTIRPQLVVSHADTCLLGYEPRDSRGTDERIREFFEEGRPMRTESRPPSQTRAECWHLERSLGRVPVRRPLALAPVAGGICALDAGRVRCFKTFQKYTAYLTPFDRHWGGVALAGDRWSGTLCVAYDSGEIRCGGGWADTESTTQLAVAPVPQPLAVERRVACALTAERQVRCWVVEPDMEQRVKVCDPQLHCVEHPPESPAPARACAEQLEKEAPTDLVDPARLFVTHRKWNRSPEHGACYACVLDRGAQRCWGNVDLAWSERDPYLSAPVPARTPLPGARAETYFIGAPESLSPYLNFLQTNLDDDIYQALGLALSDGKLWRARMQRNGNEPKEKVDYRREEVAPPVGGVLLAAAGNARHCVATRKQLICESGQLGNFTVPHGLDITNPNPRPLGPDLRRIAEHAYRRRAAVLRAAAELTTDLESEAFVARMIAPVIEGGDSELFAKEVVPPFRELRQWYSRRLDQSLARNRAEPIALRLLKATLGELRASLGASPALESVWTALGKALATPGDRGEAVARAAKALPLPTGTGVDADLAQTAQRLFDYLE